MGTDQSRRLKRLAADLSLDKAILFVLFDIWFSSKENMGYIKETLQKDFVCALKANRLAAVSEEDYRNNRFTSIEELPWQEESPFTG